VERRIAIVIGSALLVQLFVRYWGQIEEPLRWGMFYWSTAAARIGVPLIVCFALAISPGKLGLGKPRLQRREGLWILGAMAVTTLVALPMLGMDGYQDAYQGLGSSYGTERWLSWISFTASTTVSWELFYRSFLLFSLREILRSGGRGGADTLAILFTACFEVLSHLVKPPLESLAMLVGSPALSWVALRHGSVWIPLAVHVFIEFLWFMSVWD
jgi:membrane protease YdiL (CAAX protease family)